MRVRGYIKHRLRLVSDGRGSGSSMPSPGVEPNTSLGGTREKKDGALRPPQEETRECVGGCRVAFAGFPTTLLYYYSPPLFRSLIKQENPLNLSILISGGKETNSDSPSNGE